MKTMHICRIIGLAVVLVAIAPVSFAGGDPAATVDACLKEARDGGYATEFLQQRVDEGKAKGVDTAGLAVAVQERWQLLREARRMVEAAGFPVAARMARELEVSIALALESGLSAQALERVVGKTGGNYTGRVQAAVEAGETMHLAGLDDETVLGIMEDCIDRNLRRPEVIRVTHHVLQQIRAGQAGPEIRRGLWAQPGP